MSEAFFSPCPRGLAEPLAAELAEIGAHGCKSAQAGVAFEGDLATGYAVNLHSRIATRVLWRKYHGRYRNEDDVYRAAFALPWFAWFDVHRSIRVEVSADRSPLKSLNFITLKIKDAICDRFRAERGKRPDVAARDADVQIYAHFERDTFTLYLDLTGEPLFKRRVRASPSEAPLKKNLAAGILRLTGWQPATPLFDPFCGGGTFLIEAAEIALRMAPGLGRVFAFQKLRDFDDAAWKRLTKRAQDAKLAPRALPIFGSDKSAQAIRDATRNVSAAGLDGVVTLTVCDVLDATPPADHGMLIANPPYAVRVGEQEEIRALYPQLADVLKQRFTGWRAYLLSADTELPKRMRLSASRKMPLYNGALECRLYEYELRAGSFRKAAGE